jgi:hypothetical protein
MCQCQKNKVNTLTKEEIKRELRRLQYSNFMDKLPAIEYYLFMIVFIMWMFLGTSNK